MSDRARNIMFQILSGMAVFLTLSLFFFLLGIGDLSFLAVLTFPGAFLYKSFGALGFYVPVFLGMLTVALQHAEFRRNVLLPLNLSILPFFTLSALVRIAGQGEPSPVTDFFTENLGNGGSLIFLGLLAFLQVLLIGGVSLAVRSGGDAGPSFFRVFAHWWASFFSEPFAARNSELKLLTTEHGKTPSFAKKSFSQDRISPAQAFTKGPSDVRNDPFFDEESAQSQTVAPVEAVVTTAAADDPEERPARRPSEDPESGFIAGSPGSGTAVHPMARLFPETSSVLKEIDELLGRSFEFPRETVPEAAPVAESLLGRAEQFKEDKAVRETLDFIRGPVAAEAEAAPAAEIALFETPSAIPEPPKPPVIEEPPVVDWDTLPRARPAEEEPDWQDVEDEGFEAEAELDEEEEFDWKAMDEGLRSGQLSAQISPLEAGSLSAPRTIRVLESTLPKGVPHVPSVQRRGFGKYFVPTEGLLTQYKASAFSEIDDETRRSAHVLKMTLKEFNIDADVTGIRKGPVVTMFEILPAAGVKLSKIVALADNIALGLAAISVRIVAPIPGKHAVGIEVPNRDRAIVGFSEMINSAEFQDSKAEIPIVLGKDISGGIQIIDLAKTPHLLIAGATGSGKSVCVNSLICSILYKRSPDEVRLLMIDPKIVELKFFNEIPHLLAPVITEPKKALQAVQWCLYEMERRYALLDAIGAKDIKSYNAKVEKRHLATTKLPYIVFVVDEFADLMATSGKDLEGTLARLAAMSRAVGIHLVLATQRPSIDVITGLIKANFPSRIAFMVASKTDSRIIIDSMGAEKLLGRGDMLFTSSWNPFPSRIQGAFLSEDEVERVVSHVKSLGEPDYISDEIFFDDEAESDKDSFSSDEMDPLFEKAVEIVRSQKKASASFLQRRLGIGYNRAARLVESMEEMGIVGPQNGSKPRDIIHEL